MLEKFTEGRSGSFFYFTHDSRYMVKTVTQSELSLLRHILPQYIAHIQVRMPYRWKGAQHVLCLFACVWVCAH